MRSTGEVLGISHSYGRAFFKAQEATQTPLPLEGSVLFTVADRDKNAALEAVRLFKELGFKIMTTEGTHYFLDERGIENTPLRKLGYGRPDLVDAIKNGAVNLLVNTPSGRKGVQDSSSIRKAAIKHRVPYITTTAAAIAAAKGIAARRDGVPQVRSIQEYHAQLKR
jgi:carbamoyl-phosphate synthase large subunit